MSRRTVWEVYKKELRETLRDRRTLIVMVLLPLVLYPLTAVLAAEWFISHEAGRQASRSHVLLTGAVEDGRSLQRALADSGLVDVEEVPHLRVDRVDGTRLLAGADAVVHVPIGFDAALAAGAAMPVVLFHDGASDRSQLARTRIGDALSGLESRERLRRIAERGLPPTFLEPILLDQVDLATRARLGRSELGKFLPFIIVMMVLMGAFYPAIDLTAGEKERGTLEPLLATPAPRRSIVAGKYLTVATIAALTGLLNVLCMAIAGLWIAFSAARAAGADIGVGALVAALPWGAIALGLLALACASLLFSGIMVAVASLARNFKEAQNYLTPVYLVATLPAMSSTLPGTELGWGTALVPVANVALLLKGSIAGNLAAGPAILALVVTGLLSLACIAIAARIYESERLLYAPDVPAATGGLGTRLRALFAAGRKRDAAAGPRPDTPLGPGQAMALFGIVVLLMFFVGPSLQLSGLSGIVASQFLLIALPVLLFARATSGGVIGALALGRPRAAHLAGAAMIGLSGWYLLAMILVIQEKIAPAPPQLVEALEQLLDSRDASFVPYLFALAIAPAICEELLCRGALTRGLRAQLGPSGAIVVSAILFGLLHMSAYRFAPTFLLGLVLGFVTLRAASLWPAMLIHALNNGSLVFLKSSVGAGSEEWLTQRGGMVGAAAIVMFVGGLALVMRTTNESAQK